MAVGRSTSSSDGAFWSYAFVVGGFAAAAVYAADLSKTANIIAFVAVAVGGAIALFTGPRHYGAEPRATWLLLGTASVTCLIGAIVRPWAVAQTGPAALLSDAAQLRLPGHRDGAAAHRRPQARWL